MFITNGLSATLIKYNRGLEENTGVWDDEYTKEEDIVLCPYNQDVSINFGTYSVPEAKGYFIVKSKTPIKEGDQIIFEGRTLSVIEVRDEWIWNKLANIIIAVK